MAKLKDIVAFLNRELKKSKIKDDSVNGLQAKGRPEVRKIGFGVDACMELFEKACSLGCDMLIVHHGMRWKGRKQNREIMKRRLDFLKRHRMSLYAAHLPLDMHPRFGNNILLAGIAGMKNLKRFGSYHGKSIGYEGELKTTVGQLRRRLERKLGTKAVVHRFGSTRVKRAAVISGGGMSSLDECHKKGIGTFITGETRHSSYHYEKEAGINVIFLGHYKSERVGLIGLARVLRKKFNIETEFIDIPTGI